MFTHYCFTFGYAENQSLASVLMKHSVGFEDPFGGLRNLNKLFEDMLDVTSCCDKKLDKSANFCPNCGQPRVDRKDRLEMHVQGCWLELLNGDIDSLSGAGIWDVLEGEGWEFISPCGADWVEVWRAENVYEMYGFYISAPGVYDFHYHQDEVEEE